MAPARQPGRRLRSAQAPQQIPCTQQPPESLRRLMMVVQMVLATFCTRLSATTAFTLQLCQASSPMCHKHATIMASVLHTWLLFRTQ
jgi:hypothetical protein